MVLSLLEKARSKTHKVKTIQLREAEEKFLQEEEKNKVIAKQQLEEAMAKIPSMVLESADQGLSHIRYVVYSLLGGMPDWVPLFKPMIEKFLQEEGFHYHFYCDDEKSYISENAAIGWYIINW